MTDKKKKFRIDFVVREVLEEGDTSQARGISYGDEVELGNMSEFFDKCKDVARTLFDPPTKKVVDQDVVIPMVPNPYQPGRVAGGIAEESDILEKIRQEIIK